MMSDFGLEGMNLSDSSTSSVADVCISESISRRTDMNEQQRRDCIRILLHKAEGLTLPRGTQQEVAHQFGVSRWTIGRIWKCVQKYLRERQQLKVSKNYKGKVGRKQLNLPDQAIMDLPLRKRCNIRSMAASLNISKSSVHRLIKWGKIKRHSSTLKPGLTIKNKIQRLRFCLQQLEPSTINTQPTFKSMYNVIHTDEKWFFMSKISQKFYLAPSEMQPYRSTKHKSHICKVMFLVAVTRPWYGEDGTEIFDGKIGVFPLTEVVPAKRSSRLRPAGTLETKPIKNVTQSVIKHVFINQLIPAIKEKWPSTPNGPIYIQQDNATPHLEANDPDFIREANSDGFNIELLSQPPNSPDLNVLDLGFFRAIQAIMHQYMPIDIDQLVSAVKYAYYTFDSKLLNFVFLSYQYVMKEIPKCGGGNNFNLPHVAKHRLEREGALPTTVSVSTQIVSNAIKSLLEQFHRLQTGQTETEQQQHPMAEANNQNQYLATQEMENMEVDELQNDMENLSLN